MIRKHWKTYLYWIALTEIVGALAGFLSRKGNQLFQATAVQPPLSPPAIVFPIVWGILYALLGFGAARVSLEEPSPARSAGLNLFIIQLVMNFLWTLVFFNLQAYGFAAVWLALLLIVATGMAFFFWRTAPISGISQIPYLLWLLFALYLNIGVWLLNRG